MVLEAQQQQHQPIMRDFLGLGNIVQDDQAGGESVPDGPFGSVSGFTPISTDMDSTGVKYPTFNIGSSIPHNFAQRKNTEEMYWEGSAETFGLTCAARWPGMVSNSARLQANGKSNAMQLTIFYGGHVNVYNNIPFDRAEAIMHLAAKGDSMPLNESTPPLGVSHVLAAPGFRQPATAAENLCFNAQMRAPVLFAADQASQSGPLGNGQFECPTPNIPSTATSPQPVVPRALPLARKASLARFLEKRKERMQMLSPFFKKQAAPAQGEQFAALLQNAGLPELYDQYFRRPTVAYRMQEQMDMSSCAKD